MWSPSPAIRIELVNNIEAFECNDNLMASLGMLTMQVTDLATFYTNEYGHKILVMYSYAGGTSEYAKDFMRNYFLETQTILFTTSSCDKLRPIIKSFAEQNDCELQYKINISIDIESGEGSSYYTSGSDFEDAEDNNADIEVDLI